MGRRVSSRGPATANLSLYGTLRTYPSTTLALTETAPVGQLVSLQNLPGTWPRDEQKQVLQTVSAPVAM